MKSQIKIGPEFFAKAINDYANWKWALIREFMQNSIDCRSQNIGIDITEKDGSTILTVTNDGSPMTEDIVTNKLLSLGSSGKDFQGAVGGFGKAKELLYFCWRSYKILSGDIKVEGSGAEYDISKTKQHVNGTISTIVIPHRVASELADFALQFIALSSVSCKFTINGNLVEQKLPKGSYRRSLPFARIYTNRSYENLLVVRIGGIPMFSSYCKHKGCVVVELDGTSGQNLTSNRDGLRMTQRSQLEGFISDLCTNKRKALQEKKTEYIRYDGEKLQCKGFAKHQTPATTSALTVGDIRISGETFAFEPRLNLGHQIPNGRYDQNEIAAEITTEQKIEAKVNKIASAFVIKNETGNQVQVWYRPDSDKFGKYAYKLIMVWTNLLVKMHEILGWQDEFAVGFIFNNNESIAEFEIDPTNGKTYYINPVTIDQAGRQSVRYTLSDREQFNQLIATAIHELVHGMGFMDHDEDYASKLTDLFGKLLAHNKDLQRCKNV